MGRAGLRRVSGDTARSPPRRPGPAHACAVCPAIRSCALRVLVAHATSPAPSRPLSADGQGRGCGGPGRGSWGAQSSWLQGPSSRGDSGVSRAHPTECRCSRAAVLLCGPKWGSFLLPHLTGHVSDVTWASRCPCRVRGETPTTRWTSQRPPTVRLCFRDRFTPQMPLSHPSSLPSPPPRPRDPLLGGLD